MKQEERRARTIQRLVTAARRVIAEGGYERATLENIAAGAGVSKGAVYAHFDSKLDLFLLVVDSELLQADRKVEAVAGAIAAGLDVADVPRTYVSFDPDSWHAGLMSEIWHVAAAEPSVRHKLEAQRRRRFDRLAAAAIDAGDLLTAAKQRANLAGRLIDAAIVEAQLEAARDVVA
jgi:AcrR family transcriptional regulator